VVTEPLITYEAAADLDGKFKAALRKAGKEIQDLRVPLSSIRASWYRSNNAIFSLKGPGKYDDLTDLYKQQKQKNRGFVYPILRSSGRLEKSITDPSNGEAIGKIESDRQTLTLGTRVPYGAFHQYGTSKMAQREFLFAGAEQVAPDIINKRIEIWITIIGDWVDQVNSQVGDT
jgi:phage gpG-like protein